VFGLNNSEFDIYLMALFGLLGYVLSRLGCEPAPMLLAFIPRWTPKTGQSWTPENRPVR
jgi:TctA family transporter